MSSRDVLTHQVMTRKPQSSDAMSNPDVLTYHVMARPRRPRPQTTAGERIISDINVRSRCCPSANAISVSMGLSEEGALSNIDKPRVVIQAHSQKGVRLTF